MKAIHNHKSRRDSVAPLRRKLIAAVVAACYSGAHAAPVNPTVVAGQASFNLQGKTYSITNTPNAIINWQSFSIGADEITRFIQQSSDSKVLNRITGQDPSRILGSLQSNGKVFLINPNGVMFGAGSRVDVNGLVASSLNISNADFLAGKNNFDGAATAGKVSNQGTITTPSGGQIFLIAPAVENSGIISSPNGDVVLAAGHSVQLFDSKDPNVQVVVSSPDDQALNLGSIVAQGGRVGVYGALVNQRGTINANSAVRGENGKIILKSTRTTLLEAGSTTSARGNAEGTNLNTGGDIMLLGAQVGLSGDAVVDASGTGGGGTVLVGGDYQGKNAAVMNAQQSYVGKDVVIKADATVNGDGGKVVVWSDRATQVFGAISARGGTAGGNGGQVETSGHYLDMQGRVDTRAPLGASGKLLLDPSDVYIALDGSTASIAGMVGSGALPNVGGLFLDTAAVQDSLLTTTFLQLSLLTTDVTVSTQNVSGTGTGTIKVVSPLLWTSPHGLTLKADSDINLKASITGINAPLHLDAGGAIVQTTSPIDALAVSSLSAIAAGNITLDNNANTIGSTATLNTSGGNASLTAVNVNLGASTVFGTLTASAYNGDLTVSGAVQGAGGVTLSSNKAGGTVTIAGGQSVQSSGGNILLTADRMAINGNIGATTFHEVRLQPSQSSVNLALGGSAADGSGVLGLSEAELQRISVPTNGLLSIGQFNNGAGGALNVDGSLNLSSSLGGGGLLLQTQAGALNINSGATLSVPGVISLQTQITGDHRVTNAGSVTSGSGINIFAGKMTLAGGSLTAGSIGLETGNQVDIGATGNPANTLALTSADLASAHGDVLVSINSSHTGSGDIVVSAPLTVGSNLSLTAQRNIDLQAALSGNGNLTLSTVGDISAAGSIAFDGAFELVQGSWSQNSGTLPGFSVGDFKLTGGSFLRALGGDGSLSTPYLLNDVYGLQGAATLANYTAYKLANDIDASASGNWSATFRPIARSGVYTGVFDGDHHTISGLTIHSAGEDNVGLFAQVDTGTIRDVNLSGVDITGHANVGGLVGNVSQGIGYISGINVSGNVSGATNVGGLAGNSGGLISASTSSGNVTGVTDASGANIGGLVGRNTGQINTSSSSADLSSTGNGYTGGLVGSNAVNGSDVGLVTHSFASGSVYSSGEIIGGLVGDNNGGHITSSYAAGSVSGGRNVGGLAGRNNASGVISDAYATGDVSGNMADSSRPHANIGGLVGELFNGSISRVFSSGVVHPSGFSGVNGLIGAYSSGTLSGGYFNLDTAGTASDSAGATALTSEQMKQQASFVDFDFVSAQIWRIYEGHTTPMLKTFLEPYAVTVTGGTPVVKTYDGVSAAFNGSSGALASGVNGTLGYNGAVNAGTYDVGGLWSTRYDISYTGSNPQLTINPRAVSATVSAVKTYDGSNILNGQANYSFSNLVGADTLSVSGVVSFSDPNAGNGKTLTVSDISLFGNDHGNYTLSGGISGSGDILKAPLQIGGVSVTPRQYNGNTNALLAGTPSFSAFGSDDVTVALVGSGIASYDNKSVGSGKLVTVSTGGFTLGGAQADNYVLMAPTNLTGDISKAQLSVIGMTASSRVYGYDGDATGRKATVNGGTLSGIVGSEQVAIGAKVASFADKNVGNAKPITVNSIALTGNDAGNYEAVMPTYLTANITPATLTLALASREYNNLTSGSFSGATLSGALGTDAVTLVAGSATATYADKNIGSNKVVTYANLPTPGGTDGGNYVISSTGSGSITARALSTWTGGSGDWSVATNWMDGVAPSGANVLAADLGVNHGLVTYDAAAGNTTLVKISTTGTGTATALTLAGGKLTLTGSGASASSLGAGLTLAGGALDLSGKLVASNLTLTSGALTGIGSGSVLQTSGLTQTGGVIDSAGSVAVSSSGNLVVGSIRASSLTLDTLGTGATITQTQTSQLVANSLVANAPGSITLPNVNNHLQAFEAHVTAGDITLYNTVTSGELSVGPLSTTGNILIDNHGGIHTVGNIVAHVGAAGTGQVSLAAHSPVTIDSNIDGADIVLSASTDITLLNGSSLNSSHSIGLSAVNNIMLDGSLVVPSTGNISATSTGGNISTGSHAAINSGGGPVTLSAPQGSVSAPSSAFLGGTVPTISDGSAAAAAAAKAAADAAAAKAAADAAAAAAAKAAADAAAKAAADAAAKAATDAAAQAAADAAAKAVADAAAKAAADAAAKAAADAAAKAAADALAKAAADAAAQAAADAAAKAAADLAAQNQQNQPVTQAINSTVNIINSAANSNPTGARAPEVPDSGVAKTGGGSSGGSKPDDKVPDEKVADNGAHAAGGAKEATKKMYCN